MGPPDDDHDCGWKTRAADLEAKLDEVVAKMAAMERRILGPKSEKLPAIEREVRKQRPIDPAAIQATRRKNAELRATRVVTEEVSHKVPDGERTCPKCTGTKLRPVGAGKADGIARTDAHTSLRRGRARPIMDRLHGWLVERKDQYAPKSPMATAVRYALNNWDELTRFLDDARIPPDNNRSESALRVVALGRKNFLFVGNQEAGVNIAGLYSLTATCEANGVEPIAYLTEVLGRVGSHPATALDDLLPHNWRPSG